MSLQIRFEPNSQAGQPDVFTPVVVCDLCGQVIEKAAGYGLWPQRDNARIPQTNELLPLSFVHQECLSSFEQLHKAQGRWMFIELHTLPSYLTNNLPGEADTVQA